MTAQKWHTFEELLYKGFDDKICLFQASAILVLQNTQLQLGLMPMLAHSSEKSACAGCMARFGN